MPAAVALNRANYALVRTENRRYLRGGSVGIGSAVVLGSETPLENSK